MNNNEFQWYSHPSTYSVACICKLVNWCLHHNAFKETVIWNILIALRNCVVWVFLLGLTSTGFLISSRALCRRRGLGVSHRPGERSHRGAREEVAATAGAVPAPVSLVPPWCQRPRRVEGVGQTPPLGQDSGRPILSCSSFGRASTQDSRGLFARRISSPFYRFAAFASKKETNLHLKTYFKVSDIVQRSPLSRARALGVSSNSPTYVRFEGERRRGRHRARAREGERKKELEYALCLRSANADNTKSIRFSLTARSFLDFRLLL